MTAAPRYVLDADTFITPSRSYHAFDLVPAFWSILTALFRRGDAGSIDRVLHEIAKQKDRLKKWTQAGARPSFHSTDHPDVRSRFREIVSGINNEAQYYDAAKAEFAAKADGWLVAHAMTHGCEVVTFEKKIRNVKKRIPIPNACKMFGVKHLDLFEMLRRLEVRFPM